MIGSKMIIIFSCNIYLRKNFALFKNKIKNIVYFAYFKMLKNKKYSTFLHTFTVLMNVYLHFTKYILHEIMKLLLKKNAF